MPRVLNLVGKRFGQVVVLEETDEREKNYKLWLCRCDCGNTVKVSTYNLLHKSHVSCGCSEKKYPNKRGRIAEDLTGQRFGKLVVEEKSGHKNGRVCWKCICDCGNYCEVTSPQLKTGKTKSCGCLREELLHNRKDITGERFGRLVAQYPLEKRDKRKSVYWHCVCDCGNEIDVTEDGLRGGSYVSCGCKRKEVQGRVGDTLTFVDGTCIEWLKNRKTRSDNTTGYRGVFKKGNDRYRVVIGFQGKKIYLGVYKNFEDAVEVRKSAEAFVHGEYIRLYEEWREEAKKAADRGESNWEEENPLIFNVDKPEVGTLQIETKEGIKTLRY